jgi:hypothetical protein
MNHEALETVSPVESEESNPQVDYAWKKRRIILLLLAYAAILGVILSFLPEEESSLDVFGLPYLIMGIVWCFIDASEHDHRIGSPMKLVLVFFFLVGFPIYLFQTRGLRAFKTLAYTFLLIVAIFASTFVTGFATTYIGDLTGLINFAN